MTLDPAHLEHTRKVADAILYEGYLLYPYRQSSQKNQVRFQFGVLMPSAYLDTDPSERSASQTECLAECGDDDTVEILVRFLHLRRRTVQAATGDGGSPREVDRLQVGGTEFTTWDEAAETEHHFEVAVSSLLGPGARLPLRSGPAETREEIPPEAGAAGPAGWLVRRQAAVEAEIRARAERVAGPFGALKLQLRVENLTPLPVPPQRRDQALGHALIAAHTLIGIPGGSFISLTDPPEWASAEAGACVNDGTWPVLAGPAGCRNLVLSSPVILYDHPEVAAESAGDLYDATEIDEILTLRTLALTDAEKREARASDPRAASLIDRLDGLPPEMLERMHGAIRYLEKPATSGPATSAPGAAGPTPAGPIPAGPTAAGLPAAGPGLTEPVPGLPSGDHIADDLRTPWWDPGSDSSVSPETDHVMIAGVRVARGTSVIMRPGTRRADAQDLFLAGREALVEAVLQDVDGNVHVAVSPASDPVADLQRSHGRFLYFAPDEIEPVPTGTAAGPDGGKQSPSPEEETK